MGSYAIYVYGSYGLAALVTIGITLWTWADVTDEAVKGKFTLVNVFASWCIPYRDEHPVLKRLAEDDRLNIVAINYKDQSENALRLLAELG